MNLFKIYFYLKEVNGFPAGFKVVQGESDGTGRQCRDCAITGKCLCIGEKGARVGFLIN